MDFINLQCERSPVIYCTYREIEGVQMMDEVPIWIEKVVIGLLMHKSKGRAIDYKLDRI